MIYIIDHQDSFTWNVVHQFSEFDEVYCSNYFDINKKLLDKCNAIVFSLDQVHQKIIQHLLRFIINSKEQKKLLVFVLVIN